MKRWSSLILVLLLATATSACNIPVFRYALERWRPDPCQLIVFHDGPLEAEAEKHMETLRNRSSLAGGKSNTEVLLCNISTTTSSDHRRLWKELNDGVARPLPYLLMQATHSRGKVNGWHGPLASDPGSLLDSPVRKRLGERLLSGDSVVWLLLKSGDEERNAAARSLLNTQFKELGKSLKLPEGIGLPGSELHSDVPLFLKFTVLEISPDDAQEQFLVRLFSGFQPEAFAAGQPLLIPVFGRGRALEVLSAADVDADLVRGVTEFLCGACSCQVKESNPGFDLLLSADWDTELFGEGGLLPPPAKSVADRDLTPQLLTIPPGRKK
jgi:hypothetical protein